MCDEIDAEAETDQFKQRVKADKESWARDRFIASIKEEAATRVRVYEEKPPVYFTDSAGLGKAINDALALPLLPRRLHARRLRRRHRRHQPGGCLRTLSLRLTR